MFQGPEKKFQRPIAQYLRRVHKYAVLEQAEITDTGHYFAENHLIAMLYLNTEDYEKFFHQDSEQIGKLVQKLGLQKK